MKPKNVRIVNTPLQPWLITIRNKESLDENCFIAFGQTSKSAVKHLEKFICSFYDVVDIMMITNRDFVCNADYRSHESLIKILSYED